MTTVKKNKKSEAQAEAKSETLWRKPITLDSLEEDDPLGSLYRGREAGDGDDAADKNAQEAAPSSEEKTSKSANQKSKSPEKSAPAPAAAAKSGKFVVKKASETPKIVNSSSGGEENRQDARTPKISEEELKNILKIKSDSFQFTDIREILRGKSFDIYAYLRFLAGDAGVCKIKHLDMMKKLDISRPTLFKQGDWLKRLSLIEKRNVPGDHLGTSYTVRRVEDVLPVSDALLGQIQSAIESFGRESPGNGVD